MYNRSNNGKRICIKCKVEKPATNEYYYKDKNRYLGLMYRCIECDKKMPDNRNYQERKLKLTEHQKNNIKKQQKAYSKTPMGRCISLVSQYEKYDKERGYENDMNKEYLLYLRTNTLCVYCGDTPSGVDRIDNKKGHTKNNTVPCCRDCNTARMDNFTHQETFILGDSIRIIKAQREMEQFGNCVL